MLQVGTKVEIISGFHKGIKAEIVDQGTFNCFGKDFTGYKVKSHALAGTIIVGYNEVKENNYKLPEIFNRFQTAKCL